VIVGFIEVDGDDVDVAMDVAVLSGVVVQANETSSNCGWELELDGRDSRLKKEPSNMSMSRLFFMSSLFQIFPHVWLARFGCRTGFFGLGGVLGTHKPSSNLFQRSSPVM